MADAQEPKSPTVELDEEGKRLQLEAEKAKYRKEITLAAKGAAEAKASSVSDLVPSIEDAPKGDVTLGENAGAFGPWLAHRGLEQAASEIAEAVRSALKPAEGDQMLPRVLVVENSQLLPDDWAGRQVRRRLDDLKGRLAWLPGSLARAKGDFEAAIRPVRQAELVALMSTENKVLLAGAEMGEEGEAAGAAGPAKAAYEGAPAAAMKAAVDLVGLLRTDYVLTASTVTASSSELATLAAAKLAGSGMPKVEVELDGFTLVPESGSPILATFDQVLALREKTATRLAALDRALAAVGSELGVLAARIERVEEAWTAAVTAKERNNEGIADLRKEIDRLVELKTQLNEAYAPANASAAYARQVLAEADVATNGLLQAPQGGQPPLVTALARERLHSLVAGQGSEETRRFSHVLFVRTDEARGDVVTRRSIIGTSGRLGFLAGVSTSWLLLDVGNGALTGGGAKAPVHRMIYDLESGSAQLAAVNPDGALPGQDPLLKLETWVKVIVVALALFLFAVAALGIVNLVVS